jgi:molybdopterin-guanine dinucleotide biosynthesis protein A
MGRDKASLPWGGATLAEAVAREVAEAAGNVTLVGNPGLPIAGISAIPDLYPGEGPLGGILTALHHSTSEWNLVVACDMPFLSAELLTYLVERAPGRDVVIPVVEDRPEPMHAVYRRAACSEAIRQALGAGQQRMISFLDRVRVARVQETELRALDPELRSFFNTNTPEDLAAARSLAERRR